MHKLRFALFGNIYQAKKSALAKKLLCCLEGHGAEVWIDHPFYDYLTRKLQLNVNATALIRAGRSNLRRGIAPPDCSHPKFNKMRKILIIIAIFAGWQNVAAQTRQPLFDSLSYRAELQTTLAAGDHNPLWLNANRYGLSSLKRANGYVRGAIARPLQADSARRWGIGYAVDAAIAAGNTSTLIVQQAFVEGRWLRGMLTLGAKEQPMELKNQRRNSNAPLSQ